MTTNISTEKEPANGNKKLIIILQILLVVAWLALMILIAWFSSKPAETSTAQSQAVGTVICKVVIKDFKTFTQALKQYYIETVDKFVRKGAHFTEYAVLGMLSLSVFNCSLHKISDRLKKKLKPGKFFSFFLVPVLWCCLYSTTDELHQLFVDGRAASLIDVLIDTSGAVFGVLVLLLIRLIVIKIRSARKAKKEQGKTT